MRRETSVKTGTWSVPGGVMALLGRGLAGLARGREPVTFAMGADAAPELFVFEGARPRRIDPADLAALSALAGRPCLLTLPPGLAALRRVAIPGAPVKELTRAAADEVRDTLAGDSRLGVVTAGGLALGETGIGCAGLIDRSELDRLADGACALGLVPEAAVVPEFAAWPVKTMLLVYAQADYSLVCLTHDGLPLSWQAAAGTGTSGLLRAEDALAMVAAEAAAKDFPAAEAVLIWSGDAEWSRRMREAASRAFPGAKTNQASGFADVLGYLGSPGSGRLGGFGQRQAASPFAEYFTDRDRLPMRWSSFSPLLAPAAALAVSAVLLALTVLDNERRDVETLRAEVQKMSLRAHRSAKVAGRIQETGALNDFIRRATDEKPYALGLFKAVAECVPNLARLDSVSLTRQGEIVLAGRAKNEFYVTELLDTLSKSDAIENPLLRSLDVDPKTKEARFAIAAASPRWRDYYAPEAQKPAAERPARTARPAKTKSGQAASEAGP